MRFRQPPVAPAIQTVMPFNPLTGQYAGLAPGPDLPRVTMMRVKSIEQNYLECEGWDPDQHAYVSSVYVAKPYHLRETPVTGIRYPDYTLEIEEGDEVGTRTVTKKESESDPGTESEETVTPPYYVGDLIVAAKMAGMLGEAAGVQCCHESGDLEGFVATPEEATFPTEYGIFGMTDDEDRPILWQDLNIAGRVWAVPTTPYDRCTCQMKGTSGSGSKTTCTADNVKTIKGASPLEDPTDMTEELTVYNKHGWDFDDDAAADIEYNYTAARWEIYQVDCPA